MSSDYLKCLKNTENTIPKVSKTSNRETMLNNIVRSNYIFVENNETEILFSNYILGLTFQSPSSKSIIYPYCLPLNCLPRLIFLKQCYYQNVLYLTVKN